MPQWVLLEVVVMLIPCPLKDLDMQHQQVGAALTHRIHYGFYWPAHLVTICMISICWKQPRMDKILVGHVVCLFASKPVQNMAKYSI